MITPAPAAGSKLVSAIGALKYKLYGSKSYSPTEEVREKAILFMVSELQGKKKYEGKPVEELYDVAKKKIDTILRKESGSLDYFGGGFANALTSDVSIFKARNTNLPKEIRDLLGEVVEFDREQEREGS